MIRRLMEATMPVLLTLLACSQSRGQVGTNPVDWGVEPLDISRVGSAGWQFLKLPTDARSAAMGGVQSSLGFGNANSAFNNPASAADVQGMEVQFSSMKWVADIRYNSLSFVDNLGSYGTVGVHAIYL
ncbi:MAG: hypothetical protein NTZ35_07750, partial [Ignavibacteriales bacterium]|nr:hypothetical protein [Ignavibacteriales bacterium]